VLSGLKLATVFLKAIDESVDPVLEKKFEEYKELLTSRNYFANTAIGSPEYEERLYKAREKFFEKFKNEQGATTTTPSTSTTNQPNLPVSEETKKEADSFKVKGNELFRDGDYDKAIEMYTNAIILNPNAIYYCNRGIAYTKKQLHESAEKDYLKSIELDPKYIKAYDRLGYTYSQMGDFPKAIESFNNGLVQEPNNQDLINHLAQAQEQLQGDIGGMPGMPNLGGMPGMPNLAGMPGMADLLNNPNVMQNMGPIQDMLNNPQFMNMTMQLMEDPNFQGMLQNMMNNPAFANMLGGLAPPGGQPPPGGNN
jgi:tetratricopeptide (TPR) repeat protein